MSQSTSSQNPQPPLADGDALAITLGSVRHHFGSVEGLFDVLLSLDEDQAFDICIDCVIAWRSRSGRSQGKNAELAYYLLTGERIGDRFARQQPPDETEAADAAVRRAHRRAASRIRAVAAASRQLEKGASFQSVAESLGEKLRQTITPRQCLDLVAAHREGNPLPWPSS